MRFPSLPLLHAKIPRTYSGLSRESRAQIDGINVRNVRPSQLRTLAEALHKEGAISDAQRLELSMIRKPYASERDDSPVDFIESMESGAVFAAAFQRHVPGSGCADFYKGMAQFAHWLDDASRIHPPILNAWA